MHFLVAEQTPTTLNFAVWLDTTKTVAQPNAYTFQQNGANVNPDPTWVRAWTFGVKAPQGWQSATLNGVEYTSWAAYVTAEVQLLAQAEYAQLTADPQALAVQGTTF